MPLTIQLLLLCRTGRSDPYPRRLASEGGINRLQTSSKPVKPYESPLAEFRTFTKEERGLSPITVDYRCRMVRLFLDRLIEEKMPLETITSSDID
jgi:hypothetical protein